MSSNDSDFDPKYRQIVRSETTNGLDLDLSSLYESFDMNSVKWFVCKYSDCDQIERFESEMIEHLRQHLDEDKPIGLKDINDKTSDEGNSCHQMVINANEPLVRIKEEPITDDMNGSNDDFNGNQVKTEWTDCADNDWEKWVELKEVEGRDKLLCAFPNCGFGSHLKIVIKQHIKRHLRESNRNETVIPSESELWDQILPMDTKLEITDNYLPETPLAESTHNLQYRHKHKKNKMKIESNIRTNSESNVVNDKSYKNRSDLLSQPIGRPLIDVNVAKNNVLLSLKGMGSYKKLKQYIRLGVEDCKKYFYCVYNQKCTYRARRSQEIAHHIHCQHIGFYLKCIQPNCEKIFRTPNSWREHQKNHICNFGLYGYQKNVFGVCRNEYLLQYKQSVILPNNQKASRCLWNGCTFVTTQRNGIKRHIHNQHVCPYRNSDQWKNQIAQCVQYSADTRMADIPLNAMLVKNDRKVHICRRTECRAHFATEAELNKHYNMFCRYRPEVRVRTKSSKNLFNKDKQKRITESKHTISRPKLNRFERQTENLAKTDETSPKTRVQTERNTELKSSDKPEVKLNTESDCKKWIEIKVFEGVDYHLCKYNDCKYVTKFTDKINDHILKLHLGSIRTPNYAVNTNRDKRVAQKSSHSLNRSENSVKRVKTNANNIEKSSQKSNESKQSAGNATAFDMKYINGEPNYFCNQIDCKFYVKSIKQIRAHIESTHVVFKCDVENCDKQFKSQNLLDVHKRNHICGFGIKGRKSSGVCDLDHIRRYRGEVSMADKWLYPCKYLDCKYISETRTNALSHIHNRHICPNRLQTNVSQNNNFLQKRPKAQK